MIGDVETAFLSRFTATLGLLPFLTGRQKRQGELSRNHMVMALIALAIFDVAGVIAVNMAGFYPDKEFAAMGISAYGAISVVLAMIFLKEKVGLLQWFGIVMILASVGYLAIPA
jgi:drug/metabolite transporter (DMT)-like permease